jgi:hypothetical protein
MNRLDIEEGIERAAEQLMKDAGVSKLDALNIHLGKYKSQRRLEEAVRVQAFVRRKQDKVEKNYGHDFHKICSLFIVSGIDIGQSEILAWHSISSC